MNKLDIFGSKLSFRFQGKDVHRTRFGAAVTIGLFFALSVRLFTMVDHVIQGDKPTLLFQERQVDNPRRFNVTNQTFALSIGLKDTSYKYYKDTKLFKVKGIQVLKEMKFNPTLNQYEPSWNYVPFDFVECDQQNLENFGLTGNLVNTSAQNHYCFPKQKELHIEGDFFSNNYADIRILIEKCRGVGCHDETYINSILDNHFVEVAFTDTYVTPEQKDNPFKYFLRELYYPSTQNQPRDINIYLRNNYVESDFGWFSSEITTDIYPSFSFQDWQQPFFILNENNQIVDKSNEFFFKATVRFEKQKENLYKRSYQKAISIMSELGGFSQSLLTICFIICSFYSQIDLNKTLIDETFSFQEISNNNSQKQEPNLIYQGSNQPIDDYKKKSPKFFYQNNNNNQNNSSVNFKQCNIIQKQNNQASPFFSAQGHCKNMSYQSNIEGIEKVKKYQDNDKENEQYQLNQTDQSKLKLDGRNTSLINQSTTSPLKVNKTINEILQETKTLYEKKPSPPSAKIEEKTTADNDPQQKDLQEKENKFKQMYKETVNNVKFSISKYFISFFCRTKALKREKQIFDYSINQLYQHLDLQYIINKLLEVDKLKKIFLDQDQIKLIEYLPKPIISYTCDNKNKISFHQNQYGSQVATNLSELEKVHSAVKSLENIVKKQKLSKLDLKIIQQLDPKFDFLFKSQLALVQQSIEFKEQQSCKNRFYELNQLDDISSVMLTEKNVKEPSNINIPSYYSMENMIYLKNISCINQKK